MKCITTCLSCLLMYKLFLGQHTSNLYAHMYCLLIYITPESSNTLIQFLTMTYDLCLQLLYVC